MNPRFTVGSSRILLRSVLILLLGIQSLRADLVGWWTFDEGGGTAAADSSPDGSSHGGTLQNGANFVGTGKFGGAVSLDGVDDIVRIADHADFEFDQNTSFSISFWFRTTWNFPNTRGFMGKGYETSPHTAGYYIVRAGGDDIPEFDSRQTSSSTPRMIFNSNMSSGTLYDGSWHHIVVVKDVPGAQVRIYTDNGSPATRAITTSEGDWAMGVNGHDLIIGQYSNRWTQGDFDDVGIWKDQVLSDAEIGEIFQNGIASVASTDTDGDGLDDNWELLHFENLDEGDAGDFESDGLTNGEEFSLGTDPTESDSDNDGLTDGAEFNNHETDPTDDDTDNDGLLDGAEVNTHNTNPKVPDSDGDGLSDGAEVDTHSTDPLDGDSDDDGFTDGVEVAAGSDPNDSNSKPDVTDLDDLVINEFVAENKTYLDVDGDSADWIEIWNPNDAIPIPIGGWHLTDDPNDLDKWTFPATTLGANSFLVVFASGKDRAVAGSELHLSFALQKSGGYLALTRPNGTGGTEVVHQFNPYGGQEQDVSFGLYGTMAPLLAGYFLNPTPGAANDANAVQGFVADTVFSIDRGFYSTPQSVEITSATAGASIIYTTNGTLPTESPQNGTRVDAPNGLTPPTATVNITTTTQLRAQAVKSGFQPTNVDTQSYLFASHVLNQSTPSDPFQNWGSQGPDWAMDPDVVNHASTASRCVANDLLEIPTISVSLPFADMWGSASGIYADANQNLEKQCSIEYLNPNGDPADPNTERGFQTGGTIQIVGGSSANGWKSNKLSMRLKFNPDLRFRPFDKDWIPFGKDAVNRYDTLVLDARLNNVWNHPSNGQRVLGQYVRDQFIADIQNAMGGTAPHGRHMHVSVAGLYWGMFTVHERPDDNFAAEYFGGNNDDYDCIKHSPNTVVHGNNAAYTQLHSLANANLAVRANFEAVEAKLDLVDFARYMLANYYGGNTDWSHHNWYATFNKVAPGAKWHFHSWDAEHVLKGNTDNRTTDNDANTPTDLQHELMDSVEYKLIFADLVRKEFFNGGNLTPANAVGHYLNRINDINEAVRAESARWGDNKLGSGSAPHTRGGDWQNELNRLTGSYFPQRTRTVLGQFISAGWYPSTDAPNFAQDGGSVPTGYALTIASPDGGTIYYTLDGSDPREAFSGNPVGTAYSGSVELNSSATVSARVRSGGGDWSALTQALFVVGAVQADSSNLVVSEVHYRPASPSTAEIAAGFGDRGEFEFVELLNIGETAIDLTNVLLSVGIEFDFALHSTIPDLLPGARLVLVENTAAFVMRYGTGYPIAGEFQNGTQLANNGELITLINDTLPLASQTIQSFTYGDDAPWPNSADGDGYSLTLACVTDNPDPKLAKSWRASVAIGGSPGTDDSVSLSTWLASHGLGLGSELTDPDGDHLSVLLEYALGGSPFVHDTAIHPALALQLLDVDGVVSEYAVMTYMRSNLADGITMTPEYSTDLVTWQEITKVLSYDISEQAGIDQIRVRVPSPVPSVERQFVRLRVELK